MADPSASFFERMRDCSAAGSQGAARTKHRRAVRRILSETKVNRSNNEGATGLVCRMESLSSGLFLAGNSKGSCFRRDQARAGHQASQSSSSSDSTTQTLTDAPDGGLVSGGPSENAAACSSQENRVKVPRSRQGSKDAASNNPGFSGQEGLHGSSSPLGSFESRYVVSDAIGVGSFSRVLKVFERHRGICEDVVEDSGGLALACKAVQLLPPESSSAADEESSRPLNKNDDDRAHRRSTNASAASPSPRTAALEEARMLKTFSEHPSFLEFKESSFSDCGRVCYIVTQFAHGGDLSRFLEARGRISEQEVRQVVLCVLEGLAHMHERGIAHRDIKLDNILILNDGNLNRVVLGDLGMAKRLDDGPRDLIAAATTTMGPCSDTVISGDLTEADNDNEDGAVTKSLPAVRRRTRSERHSICGNPMHMAPEMLQQPSSTTTPTVSEECHQYNGNGYYDSGRGRRVSEYDLKVDIWACGIIMYRLLSGEYPFQPSPSNTGSHSRDGVVEVFRAIQNGKYSLSGTVWDDVSESGKDLLQQLLTYDAANRPTAREATNHSWFAADL